MKFRLFSIFAGIGEAIVVFVFFRFLLLFFLKYMDDWEYMEVFMLTTFLLTCALILLPYPIYLFRKNQKGDAIATLVSSMVSVGIGLFLMYLMINQMFGGID